MDLPSQICTLSQKKMQIFYHSSLINEFNVTQCLLDGQVLPYIDGFNPTCRIAVEADVEINLVKSCLQNLL